MRSESLEVLDVAGLHSALGRCCDALEGAAPELNALDARLGDGDLGTTLAKCAGNLRELLAVPPATLEALLKGCAQACARASGSSFGTLLAVAFLSAAKTVGQRDALDRDTLVALLDTVGQALSQRGGAVPGDKTMLDSLAAIASALRNAPDLAPPALKAAARSGAQGALDAFRGQPNRIGRARMFAERSIGLDDPGMVAVQRMVQAI
ncbi:MAG: PTS-dependent dihydroxyacetone kinase [Ramlibacter sp.]|nr:PTS-dependent dihydroxyacetone kinase [Ramlibacter sp.]